MQTMVLDERLERRSRADRRSPHPGQRAAAATAELVARADLGEQAAWDRLVDRYGAMVWAVARARGLGPTDAADVSQVTWLLLTQHLGTLQQPERVGDWLLRTATREADRMRRLRGGVPDAGAHDGELPPDRARAVGSTPAPTAGEHRRVS
jgi:DNA-directed RNA polymerase specialized sigma24 family protein